MIEMILLLDEVAALRSHHRVLSEFLSSVDNELVVSKLEFELMSINISLNIIEKALKSVDY